MNILKSRKTNIINLVIIFFIILLICVSLFLLSIFKVIINLTNPQKFFHSIECITKTSYSSFFSEIFVDLPNYRNKHKKNLNDIFGKNYNTFIKNDYNKSLLNFDIKYSFGKLRFISNFGLDYNNRNQSKKINLNKDLFSISFDNLFNMNKNQLINHIFSQIKNYAKWFNKNFICQFAIHSYNNIFNDNMHSDIDKCGEVLSLDNNKDNFVNSYKKELVEYLIKDQNIQDTVDLINQSGENFNKSDVRTMLNDKFIIKKFIINIDLLSNYIKREINNLLLTDIKSNFEANFLMRKLFLNKSVKKHLTQMDKNTLSNLSNRRQTDIFLLIKNNQTKSGIFFILTTPEERKLIFENLSTNNATIMYKNITNDKTLNGQKHNRFIIEQNLKQIRSKIQESEPEQEQGQKQELKLEQIQVEPPDKDIPRYFIKINKKNDINTLMIDNGGFFKRNGIYIKINKGDIFHFNGKYFDINSNQVELDESLKEIKKIFDLFNENMVEHIDNLHYNNIKTTINNIQSNILNNDNSNNENMYNNIIDYLNYYKLFIVIYIVLCLVILITFIPYALFPKLKKNKFINIILNTLYGILILCLIIFNLVLSCAVLYFNNKDVFNKFDINNEVEIPLQRYDKNCIQTNNNIVLDIENTAFKIDDGGILFTTISIILILFNIYLFSKIFY